MTWNIVSDSSCDLRTCDFHSDAVHFELVPLRLQVGAKEFVDNDELSVRELLDSMAGEKSASSTACPSPGAFARAFEKADKSVCFTISANLSGTYAAAQMGRELALEEHPEKEICIIDSKATAGAMVLLIRRAKELLMDVNRMTEEEAHRLLQRRSMERGVPLAEAAGWVIDSYTL